MDFIGTIKLVFRTLLARKGRSFLTILGIGAVIAVIGGAMFVVLMVLTLLFGKKVPLQP